MKTVRLILWGLVLVVGAVVAGVTVGRMVTDDPSIVASSSVGAQLARSHYEDAGGPFKLIDTTGETVTAEDLEGKPYAMFFGFTHCPDVCPTSMLDAHGWLEALGENADDINIIFVSVDPARDTPQILGEYLAAFDDRLMGLTAQDEATIAEVADRYEIRYEKVPLQDGDYTMNHTADTLLFDAEGEFAGYIPFTSWSARQNEKVSSEKEQEAVAALKELIEG